MSSLPPCQAHPAPAELLAPSWQMHDQSTAATAVCDMDGRLTYVNTAWLALWGYAQAVEVIGRTSDTLFWPDPASAGEAQARLRRDGSWQGRIPAVRADGSPLPLSCTTHLLRSTDGRAQAMMAIFTDLRAEVAVRNALENQRQFLEAVLSAAGVLAFVLDRNGHFVRFNTACEQVSGWRAQEILGHCPWGTVLRPTDAETDLCAAFAETLSNAAPGVASRETKEWLARDGSRHLIEWTNTLLVTGTGQRTERFMVSIGIEITASRANESRLQRAQRVAQLGTWEVDLVTGRFEWSDEIFRMWELDADDASITYERFLETIHPDDRAQVASAHAASLVTHERYCFEHRLLLPDGRVKWVEERCELSFDAAGHPLRRLGTAQDVTERHRRDAELQKFRHMVDQGSQEVWLIDSQMRIRYANAAAANSLGYTDRELQGMRLADIDVGGDAFVGDAFHRSTDHFKSEQGPMAIEVEHRAKNGRRVPKEIRTTCISVDGETFGCSFAIDISDRRRAQAALADSRAQLMATLDINPGWVVCADDDLAYVFVNEQLAQDLGRPKEALIGRTVDELLGPRAADDLRAINRRLLTGETVQLERRYVRADGEERVHWVHYRVEIDGLAPGRHLYYAFGSDITEWNRTERRLKTVISATHTGVWEWNVLKDEMQINDQLPMLAGYASTDLPASPIAWLQAAVHPEDRDVRTRHLARLITGRAQSFECEYRVRHKQGHWLWVLERGQAASFSDDGKPILVIGTTQDISTLKEQQLKLQRLNEDLEQRVEQRTQSLAVAKAEAERASAAKTEFLSHMSHELRTPLNAIIGFGQLLKLSPLPAEESDYVKEVIRAGHHLLDLINEILDMSSIESGRITLTLTPVALRDLVTECASLVRPITQRHGLHLENRVSETCHPAIADRGRLKQVLLNLLSNAVKYNRPGGKVVVDCQCNEEGICELRISDTGAGLSPEQIGRLFQPFERLEAGRSGVQGTGIGLSMSKRLVELMEGEIGVSSTPGEGSAFWVRLPAVRMVSAGNLAAESDTDRLA